MIIYICAAMALPGVFSQHLDNRQSLNISRVRLVTWSDNKFKIKICVGTFFYFDEFSSKGGFMVGNGQAGGELLLRGG